MKRDCILYSDSQKVCMSAVCERNKRVLYGMFLQVGVSASKWGRGASGFCPPAPPHTVLSSIHSVLLNVTLLLARGDGSVLSWLVDLCHLVLALRG